MSETQDSAQEFSESLGLIADGFWRQLAWAIESDIPRSMGLSVAQWSSRYRPPVQLDAVARKAAVRELKDGHPDWSSRIIAAALGVSHMTVARDLEPEDSVTNDPPEPAEPQVRETPPEDSVTNDPPESPPPEPVVIPPVVPDPEPQMQSPQEAQADPVGRQISENMAAAELVLAEKAYARDVGAALRHVGPLADGTRMHLQQVHREASAALDQVSKYLETGVSPLDAEIEDLLGGNQP